MFLVGGWLTHLWFRFTPVYQDIVCKLGQPKLSGIHLGIIGLTPTTLNIEIAAQCTNPNFYHIGVETAEKGQVSMTNSRTPVGWAMASPYSPSALPAHATGTIYTTAEVSVSGPMLAQLAPQMVGGAGIPVFMELNNKMKIDISFFFGSWGVSAWFRKKCGMEIASLLDLLNSKDQVGPVACADSWNELVVPRLSDRGDDEIILAANSISPEEVRMGALAKNIGLGGFAALFYLGGLAMFVCACLRLRGVPGKGGMHMHMVSDEESGSE